MEHPTVEVTLLFTDIEGSTALVHELGDRYVDLLAEHNRIMRRAIDAHVGAEARNDGDSFFVVFPFAADAVSACLDAQRALASHEWLHGRPLGVRMGLHTGPAVRLTNDYAGLNVHLAARIMGAGHGGQVLASASVVEALPKGAFAWTELGDHILKDFPEPVTLFQLSHPELAASFPPLVTIDARDHNLPSTASSFVGRQNELADIRTLLSGTARLVTITGPGGVGKTRIAVEAAWSVLSRFRGGAWFVDFSTTTDPGAFIDVIADALGLRDERGRSRRGDVADALGRAPALLVLDNLEHLLSGVVDIATLLSECPTLVALATSRERLRLQGEHEVVLSGLDDTDAAALFEARAAAAQRELVLDDRARDLCRRVDGIPLAIELAAARLRSQSIESLLAAMDRMLDALDDGERDRPERHRAMRAAIAVSVDALTEAERSVFRAFAVFSGGARADAIAAVCGPKADEVASLLDKSLLTAKADRFVMLEPIRQYAEERLANDVPGEREQRADAHARYFLALAEDVEPLLVTSRQQGGLDVLSADYVNLRLAWERADGDVPLRIAACLSRFWAYRGNPSEGRAVLEGILAARPTGDLAVRAKASLGVGHLAVLQGDLDQAVEALRRVAAIGDPSFSAPAHNLLGEAARLAGDQSSAEAHYADALALAESIDDDRLVAMVRSNQGALAFTRGNFDEAADLFRSAVTASQRIGDVRTMTRGISNLGLALRASDAPAEARAAFEKSLAWAREAGDRGAEAAALVNLAVTPEMSDRSTAAAREDAVGHLHAAAEIYDSLGFRRELAQTLLQVPAFEEDTDESLRAVARARALFTELRDQAGVDRADAQAAAVLECDFDAT